MKKTILFILILIPFNFLMAQTDTIKIGAYRNYADFINNKPFISKKFSMTYRNEINILPVYKVVNDTPKVKREIIEKQTWAIYNGEFLYINSIWVNLEKGYIKVQEYDHYSYFDAAPMMSISQQETIGASTFAFGFIGGVVSSAAVNGKMKKNTHYILDLNKGSIQNLDKGYLNRILESEPDLYDQYNMEDNQEDLNILKKYIKLLNGRMK